MITTKTKSVKASTSVTSAKSVTCKNNSVVSKPTKSLKPLVTKKTSRKTLQQDLYSLLLKDNSKDQIHTFVNMNGADNWNWARTISRSVCWNQSGMIIFVGVKDEVLYIGQSAYLSNYVSVLKYRANLYPFKIFVVLTEDSNKLIHAVNAYRAKYKPLLNSTRGTNFIFDRTSKTLNLSLEREAIVNWIINHPTKKRKDFLEVYSVNDLKVLCAAFECKKLSYYSLKAVIAKHRQSK